MISKDRERKNLGTHEVAVDDVATCDMLDSSNDISLYWFCDNFAGSLGLASEGVLGKDVCVGEWFEGGGCSAALTDCGYRECVFQRDW